MTDRWERLAPLTGIVAVALWIIGAFTFDAVGDFPENNPQGVLATYADNENEILLAGFTFQLGALFFIWFLGSLRSRLLVAEGGLSRLTAIAFASGLAVAVFLVAFPGGDQAAALSEDLTPDAAVALNNLTLLFFLGAELTAAVLLIATGLLSVTRGAFPRWLGWGSLLLALWLLIPPIGWLGLLLGFPLWTLAVSLLLYLRPAVAEPPPAV
jgi:hypothetical protein